MRAPAHFSHFGFLPLDQFSMIAFSNAVEVLRMANYLERAPLYRWSVLSADGRPVAASNGLSLPAALPGADRPADLPDIVFVCGGEALPQGHDAATLDLLRGLAADGVALGSLCAGAHALAAAGLLDGYRCASHWAILPALAEAFASVRFSYDLFVIDRDRYSCGGGVAPLDMMLDIIAPRVGVATIAGIADQFTHEHVRGRSEPQQVPLAQRLAEARPALLEVAQLMEANLEEPLALDELARLSQRSPRQLQRMFRQQLDTTPAQYYLALRLDKARALLRQSGLSLAAVAAACGFQSLVQFKRAYRERFQSAPSAERQPRRD
jgi:transcriptional regulator GlxA family with amidase domain